MSIKHKSINEKLGFAIAIHQQGQLEEAEKIYKAVLKIQPSNPDALHFFGILLHQVGQSSRAIESINRALRISPHYLDAYLNLGNIFKETGDMISAASILRKLIQMAPHFAQAYNNLAVVLRNSGELDESIQYLQTALELAPDTADFLYNLGTSYQYKNEVQKAVDAYQRSIDLKPDQKEAYQSLWKMLRNKGKFDAANDVLLKWMKSNPEDPIAKHHYLACAGGEIPERASDAYIQETFDNFAASFDDALTQLDYKAPELVIQAVSSLFAQAGSRLSVLDAGCGTGLCGPLLKPYAKRLVGVDLSTAMLNKAKGRKVYDELVAAELVDYLKHHHSVFDLIISADTLCYFGDLQPFFQAAFNCLNAGGYLIFTLERLENTENREYQLNPHGRYSHTPDYVGSTLASCGFNLLNLETVGLRQESGEPVDGLLITAGLKES